MEEDDKHQKKGLLKGVKKGLEKAVKTLATSFVQPEPEIISEEFKSIIAEELTEKLMVYYNGSEPGINDLTVAESSAEKEFNVTARVTNLSSASSGILEANLQAEMEMPDVNYYHIPVPGAYGADAFPLAPLPIYNDRPKIIKMVLDITSPDSMPEVSVDDVQKSISEKYPRARLIDTTTPTGLTGVSSFCERLVNDITADSKGKCINLLRLVKIDVNKVPAESMPDGSFLIRDYEFRLQIQDVFTVEFPRSGEMAEILKREKTSVCDRAFEGTGQGFPKSFFRIRAPFGKIEPCGNAAKTEVSFNVEFDCVSGIGPFSKVSTVSAVMLYAIDQAVNGKGETVTALRHLKSDNFAVHPVKE